MGLGLGVGVRGRGRVRVRVRGRVRVSVLPDGEVVVRVVGLDESILLEKLVVGARAVADAHLAAHRHRLR